MKQLTGVLIFALMLLLIGGLPVLAQQTVITNACEEVRDGGIDGTWVSDWRYYTNGGINDILGIATTGTLFFNVGDTIVVDVLTVVYPPTTVRVATSRDTIPNSGATADSVLVPGRITYTVQDSTHNSAFLVATFGVNLNTLSHGDLLMTFTFTCIPAGARVEIISGGPPDDRVNWQLGDDVAAIFVVSDSEDNPAYHVYQPATPDTDPYEPLVITQADVPTTPPDENTWLGGEGLVNAYVLTTGEIQFNIGPTPDGKVRVVIFPDFSGVGAYGYEYNIYDVMSQP